MTTNWRAILQGRNLVENAEKLTLKFKVDFLNLIGNLHTEDQEGYLEAQRETGVQQNPRFHVDCAIPKKGELFHNLVCEVYIYD